MTDNGFSRRATDGIPFYICRALEAIPHLRHGFSTRIGGVSTQSGWLNLSRVAWDTQECVEENRRRFLSAIGLAGSRLSTLSQIHSDRVHIIENNPEEWNGRAQGDALVTSLCGVAVAVQVADCFPILIADTRTPAVAVVHAGWRGIHAGIVSRTLLTMREACGCDPSSLLVAIGPGIRSCCFEVGQEVAEPFKQQFPGADLARSVSMKQGKYMLDLPAALNIQVRAAGIDQTQVLDLGICTCCHTDEFFSYRREGRQSGRMMGIIGLESDHEMSFRR